MASILVYIEREKREATASSLAALNVGRSIASGLGGALYALLPCAVPPSYGKDDIIAVLSRHGADKVVLATHADLDGPALHATHGAAVEAACRQVGPRLILFPASGTGEELAPRLAIQLGADYVAHAQLQVDGAEYQLVCDVFRRRFRLLVSLRQASGAVVATLAPSCAPTSMGNDEAEVVVIQIPSADATPVQLRGRRRAPTTDLTTASLVVAGGAGLAAREQHELLRRLAALLGGAAAASAKARTTGLSDAEVVGLDGSYLAARLYLALGVSGSERHVAGLPPGATVVAVNSDAAAPLLRCARLGLEADAGAALRELVQALEDAR